MKFTMGRYCAVKNCPVKIKKEGRRYCSIHAAKLEATGRARIKHRKITSDSLRFVPLSNIEMNWILGVFEALERNRPL